jgi:peroxiredoxin
MKRAAAFALLLAASACGPAAVEAPTPKHGASLRVGDRAPDFDVMNASRNTADRIRLVKGKVNLVVFWSTSSEKETMPTASELVKRYESRGLVVAAIAVDEDVMDVARVGRDMGATFDLGWDESKAAQTRYQPPRVPSFFVVDRAGVVRYLHAGYLDSLSGELDRECASLL